MLSPLAVNSFMPTMLKRGAFCSERTSSGVKILSPAVEPKSSSRLLPRAVQALQKFASGTWSKVVKLQKAVSPSFRQLMPLLVLTQIFPLLSSLTAWMWILSSPLAQPYTVIWSFWSNLTRPSAVAAHTCPRRSSINWLTVFDGKLLLVSSMAVISILGEQMKMPSPNVPIQRRPLRSMIIERVRFCPS